MMEKKWGISREGMEKGKVGLLYPFIRSWL